jgi:Putative auto-transporter adhesin, head GIN domain
MKRIFMLVAVLIICLSASAQKKEVRDVASFKKIGFGGGGTLYLKQGSPQKLELEGKQETLDKYETIVEGDKLSIRPKERWNSWNWGDDDEIIVYVTVETITGLAVSGSGDIIGQTGIKTNELDLKVSGSGSLKIEANVSGDLESDVSGSGNIDIKGSAGSFESDISGSGDVLASLKITGQSDFSIAGSGKIIIDGSAKSLKSSISGSGSVKGENFMVETCDVKVAGSGNVYIHVVDDLKVSIAGSGDVRYKGNPKKVNSNAAGSGSVRKL